jgi:hypothetical protein
MVTRTEVPAAIEGRQVSVVGQKIMPTGRPQKLSDSNEIVFPIRVSRRAKSTIEEENDPKESRFKNYSLLDLEDCIEGNLMWGFSSDVIGRNSVAVGGGGRTSQHPGQELTISGMCFMELLQGWIGVAIDVHPRDELLQR